MNYLSTTGNHRSDHRAALLNVSAPDGSLYLPEVIPTLPGAFIRNMSDMTPDEIAFAVANTLIPDIISPENLRSVAALAFPSPVPLSSIPGGIRIAELFHGPTLSYKDYGARFATGFLGHLLRGVKPSVVGIVATTGNTGAALSATFSRNMPPDARLVVLYPAGRMTRAQIAQFTTPGNHVIAIEVAGDISDCRNLAKALEANIRAQRPDLLPVSLNSDNFLRIIPQVALLFHVYAKLLAEGKVGTEGIQLFIPSGNLTNVTAAALARRMGLPVSRIVSVTAEGSAYARAVITGPAPVNRDRVSVLASDPSVAVESANVSDPQISDVIRDAGSFLPDPHTAAAIHAARTLAPASPALAVVPATAHPAKSLDAMTAITGRAMELPLQLTRFMHNNRPAARIAPSLQALKKYLASASAAGII